MIWTSVGLAIFLAWPMVFGSAETSSVRAAGAKVAAAAGPKVEALLGEAESSASGARFVKTAVKTVPSAQSTALENCFKRYEREYARCSAVNSSCRLTVADQWDLCEATGVWP